MYINVGGDFYMHDMSSSSFLEAFAEDVCMRIRARVCDCVHLMYTNVSIVMAGTAFSLAEYP